MTSATHRRRVLGSVWLCLAAALVPSLGIAAPAHGTVVLIAQEDADPMTERALDAIGAGLVDLPVSLASRRVAGWDNAIVNRVEHARSVSAATGAIAVIWLDLSAPQHVFLFIADSSGGRVLVRTVQTQTQDVEAQLETLSVIVRSSVEGLLAGGEIGVEQPPTAPARGEQIQRLGASIGYALQLFAPTEPVVHDARIEVHTRLSSWLFLLAAYRLAFPIKAESPEVSAQIWSHPIELGLFGQRRFTRWRLDVGIAAVVDIVTFDVMARDSSVDAADPAPQATFAVSPSVRIERVIGRVAAVFFSVDLDVELYNHRYVVTATDNSRVVVAPWRVRPIFELGVEFTLL
jgi:hypothetical protein